MVLPAEAIPVQIPVNEGDTNDALTPDSAVSGVVTMVPSYPLQPAAGAIGSERHGISYILPPGRSSTVGNTSSRVPLKTKAAAKSAPPPYDDEQVPPLKIRPNFRRVDKGNIYSRDPLLNTNGGPNAGFGCQ
jgi:hypothetical protein